MKGRGFEMDSPTNLQNPALSHWPEPNDQEESSKTFPTSCKMALPSLSR